MYADRVTAESGSNKRSIKDRLNDSAASSRGTSRQSNAINTNTNANKRQRQNDNKWKHDLYEEDELSNPKVGVRDLRQKLQKRGLGQLHQSVKGSNGKGPQDLRQKLSGTMHAQPANIDLPDSKEVVEVTMPARKSIPVEVPTPEIKKPTNTASRKKSQQKAEASVDSLLQSLGLEKYSITFQAEEIDMTALMHMNDDDLRALGVPMGPRKKILLALDSRA